MMRSLYLKVSAVTDIGERMQRVLLISSASAFELLLIWGSLIISQAVGVWKPDGTLSGWGACDWLKRDLGSGRWGGGGCWMVSGCVSGVGISSL